MAMEPVKFMEGFWSQFTHFTFTVMPLFTLTLVGLILSLRLDWRDRPIRKHWLILPGEATAGSHTAPIEMPPITLAGDCEDIPPIPGSWRDLSADEAEPFIVKIAQAAKFEGISDTLDDLRVTTIRQRTLACYEDVVFLDVQLEGGSLEDTRIASVLMTEHGATLLNGTSARLHTLSTYELSVDTPEECQDFLRLFCAFVHSDEGPLQIVEAFEDIPFEDENAKGAHLQCNLDIAAPVNAVSKTDLKRFRSEHVSTTVTPSLPRTLQSRLMGWLRCSSMTWSQPTCRSCEDTTSVHSEQSQAQPKIGPTQIMRLAISTAAQLLQGIELERT